MNTNTKKTMLLALAMLIFALTAYAESRKQLNTTTVTNLDLQKFMGRWYEIARLDNRFERGMTDVEAEYTLLDDGTIRIVNSGMRDGKYHQTVGRGKLSSEVGRLRVSFFMFFYSDYNILEMAQDGQWVLVGGNSPKYLWILSREKQLPADVINHIIGLARGRGYDTNALIFSAE